MRENDVYGRLRAVYRRLLEAPNNHVIVAPYPVAYPALPFEAATKAFVNNFAPWAIERMGQVLNDEIKRAVDDEAARLRSEGGGNRLFMMSPKRFNIGLPGYDMAVNGASGVSCPTYGGLGFRVDGPSNQSYATQSSLFHLLCPSANDGDIYFESLDGGLHLSPNGAKQYADALDDKVRDIGLPVPPP
jgi:hypothetical protein